MIPERDMTKRGLARELLVATAALIIAAHLLYAFRTISFVANALPIVVPLFFLYVPVLVIWKKGRKIDFLDRGVRSFLRSFVTFVVVALIVFPPFFLGAHVWQQWVFGAQFRGFTLPPNVLSTIFMHLVIVALPEEFYFRGYFQSTIDRILPRRWSILGVKLGWGWIITSGVFAFAHTVVVYQWWHFSIFFPALLFGYLRERTGSITASILFHAVSNVLMHLFTRCYAGTVPGL